MDNCLAADRRMESLVVTCECESGEHMAQFHYDDADNTVFLSVHLSTYENIFQRAWTALKYVFGYRCRYGEWDSLIVHPADQKKIIALLGKAVANQHRDCEGSCCCDEETPNTGNLQ